MTLVTVSCEKETLRFNISLTNDHTFLLLGPGQQMAGKANRKHINHQARWNAQFGGAQAGNLTPNPSSHQQSSLYKPAPQKPSLNSVGSMGSAASSVCTDDISHSSPSRQMASLGGLPAPIPNISSQHHPQPHHVMASSVGAVGSNMGAGSMATHMGVLASSVGAAPYSIPQEFQFKHPQSLPLQPAPQPSHLSLPPGQLSVTQLPTGQGLIVTHHQQQQQMMLQGGASNKHHPLSAPSTPSDQLNKSLPPLEGLNMMLQQQPPHPATMA